MQASHKEIHAFLLEYSGASNRVQAGKFKRDQLRLEFEGGAASTAKLRDLRNTCCMIDIGSSIFTLNFRDVTTFSIPNEPGTTMPVLTVRLGSLARDMNARMARDTRRSSYFERSSDRSYTQPRPAAAEAGIPLNPPGGLQLEVDTDEQEPAPYNRLRRDEQPEKVKAQRESAAQRQSLDEIEEMLNQLWKTPER